MPRLLFAWEKKGICFPYVYCFGKFLQRKNAVSKLFFFFSCVLTFLTENQCIFLWWVLEWVRISNTYVFISKKFFVCDKWIYRYCISCLNIILEFFWVPRRIYCHHTCYHLCCPKYFWCPYYFINVKHDHSTLMVQILSSFLYTLYCATH